MSVQSCPAIRVYKSGNLDEALDAAARNFVREEVKLYPDKLEVFIPCCSKKFIETLFRAWCSTANGIWFSGCLSFIVWRDIVVQLRMTLLIKAAGPVLITYYC